MKNSVFPTCFMWFHAFVDLLRDLFLEARACNARWRPCPTERSLRITSPWWPLNKTTSPIPPRRVFFLGLEANSMSSDVIYDV